MRHVWKPWKKVQRCCRPGCPALRRPLARARGKFEYRLPRWLNKQFWTEFLPPCTGDSTANRRLR